MRIGAAQEGGMRKPGDIDIVGVAAPAGDEPRGARLHGLCTNAVTIAGIRKMSAIISMVSQTYGMAAR